MYTLFDISFNNLEGTDHLLKKYYVSWGWAQDQRGYYMEVKFDFKGRFMDELNNITDPNVASTIYMQIIQVRSKCNFIFTQMMLNRKLVIYDNFI